VKNPHDDVAIPPLLPRRKSSRRIVSKGIDLAAMMQEEDDVDVDANGDGDNDDKGSNDDDNDDDDDVGGMSKYKLKRMRNMARNNARLASLGLLVPMTSAATLSSSPSNGKKRSASQDNVERRVQPKRNAKQPTSYRVFNDDNNDNGDELDSDTIDSVLLSDEDGNLDDDDDDSHDKLDIDTNDSDLQSNEGGEEALVNNDDLKPSARHTVLPPPPMPLLDNAKEEEEEEEEEVITVNYQVNHPNDEETSLMMKAFTTKSSTSNVLSPNPALADKLISMIRTKFKDGAVTDVSQFSVRYEYLLLARPAKARR